MMDRRDVVKTVFLIDDDVAVRKALALVLRSVQLNAVTFASAEEFLAAYQPPSSGDRHCLITDVRMPGMSGLELQGVLAHRKLFIPIIVISAHADIPQAVRAMRAGALSVLEKPVNEQELIDVINQALNAQEPHDAASRKLNLDACRERLTKRQCEVFDLLMQGLQTKEVARHLSLSHRTVEVHRAKILERLDIASFSHLLRRLLGAIERR